ncbi:MULTISPECIES: winged helix-turn-helix domain-containing protein [Actinomyces]|uniref:Response regulator transcription factor n=1 Tax=Actinomyces respiraculi TaxID=2744574 RepID=A0A7T0LKJ9_9ACTO|nr:MULTISPECIES: response regulator transcription factor [Actinomyces]QPL05141.1 response regulator transcription factor [Actinomyces respiraculi]
MRAIMLTREADPSQVLPAATLLNLAITCLPPVPASYSRLDSADVVLIDARGDLMRACALCQLLTGPMSCPPVLLVMEEGGAAAVQTDWGASDFVLVSAGPAEVSARLRMLRPRGTEPVEPAEDRLEVGDLVIDATAYTVRVRGAVLDLTYKEFELLKYLALHQGKVLTRETILDDVWGVDYIGGSRTVDVHVRRLRAKLGPEHDHLIGTVRNVGYRLDPPDGP